MVLRMISSEDGTKPCVIVCESDVPKAFVSCMSKAHEGDLDGMPVWYLLPGDVDLVIDDKRAYFADCDLEGELWAIDATSQWAASAVEQASVGVVICSPESSDVQSIEYDDIAAGMQAGIMELSIHNVVDRRTMIDRRLS
tara:strand:+ start:38208 stop:38627 length:420 start_codon:yes stop_codon:yes gene_type:complete